MSQEWKNQNLKKPVGQIADKNYLNLKTWFTEF